MTKDRGTDAYMAPEVRALINPDERYDYKADIYSLGIVFTQVLFHLNKRDFTNFIVGQDFNKTKHHAVEFFKVKKNMEIPKHE
jgi:serine/threonine protein kinase